MNSFIKHRPPLVIFFLCLLTLAITVFCFAFYIKNTDSVPDTDRNYAWITMLKHFNSLETCLETNHNLKDVNEKDYIETSEVQVVVSVNNSEFFKKFTSVKGYLTLDNWQSNCPNKYDKPSHLEIYFEVPSMAKTNVTEFDVCVTIKGAEAYLPKFKEPNCVAPAREDEKAKMVEAYLSTSVRIAPEDFCKTGVLSELKFQEQNRDNFANFLSENEKGLIYVHLLWTSYFLVFILLLIVIYGTLHSEHVFDKYIHKTLLNK